VFGLDWFDGLSFFVRLLRESKVEAEAAKS
jgi:hypothetical protein